VGYRRDIVNMRGRFFVFHNGVEWATDWQLRQNLPQELFCVYFVDVTKYYHSSYHYRHHRHLFLRISVFWYVTLCKLHSRYRRFEWTHCHHFQVTSDRDFWRWRLAAPPKHGSYTPIYTSSWEAFSLVPLRTYNFALSILIWVWICFVRCDNFIIPRSAGCSKSVPFWRPLELDVHHVCNGLCVSVVLRCVWNYAGAVLLNPFPGRDKWWSSV
jgi:hypothetical protein